MKIDFVVTWVDGSDPVWQKKKKNFSDLPDIDTQRMNSEKAYREWGTFKYWFRGVEKFAPWVNHIYLITDHQVPMWLGKSNKLTVIDHSDIMDPDDLPVFNSNAIEVCMHRIKGLTEHFVYFNDDMYLTAPVKSTDFFTPDGLPVYNTAISPIIPERFGTANFQVNDMEIINSHFSRDEILKNGHFLNPKQGFKLVLKTLMYRNSRFICGFFETHLPYPFRKSTIKEIWKEEPKVLQQTARSRFRAKTDINLWLFKYWEIARGSYSIGKCHFGKLFSLDNANTAFWKLILSGKYHVMCINDGFHIEDKDRIMNKFNNTMKKLLPRKSDFEK